MCQGYNPNISRLYVGYYPIDPNHFTKFLGHPSTPPENQQLNNVKSTPLTSKIIWTKTSILGCNA